MKNITPQTPLDIAKEKFRRRQMRGGYGLGLGRQYVPTWRNYQVSSRGNKFVVNSWLTGRCVHLFSTLECRIFRALQRRQPRPLDIREQVYHDLDETWKIALELGFDHPTVPHTSLPHVGSTDLVVTWQADPIEIIEPIYIKPKDQLDLPRNVEKRAIDEAYWARRHKKLTIATEDFLTRREWMDIKWCHERRDAVAEISDADLELVRGHLLARLARPTALGAACGSIARETGLAQADVVTAARYLLSEITYRALDDQPVYSSKRVVVLEARS